MAVEDRRAENGLQQIVRQGGPADGGERTGAAPERRGTARQHHEPDVAEADRDARPVVELLAEEERPERPSALEVERDAEGLQREAGRDRHRDQRRVETRGAPRAEHLALEERHSDQHQAARAPDAPRDQGERLEQERPRGAGRLLIEPAAAEGGELGLDHRRRRPPQVVRERRAVRLRPVRQRQARADGPGRADGERRRAERQQPAGRLPPQRIDQHPADRVEKQDVAGPEQVGVQQPDDRQPRHPAVVRPPGAARPGPARHQDDAGAEEHREDRHELLVGEHPAGQPDPEVRPFEVAVGGRVEVSRLGHRERLDVHDEDAEQGEAPQDVDRVDARALRDGPGVGACGGTGHVAVFLIPVGACQRCSRTASDVSVAGRKPAGDAGNRSATLAR